MVRLTGVCLRLSLRLSVFVYYGGFGLVLLKESIPKARRLGQLGIDDDHGSRHHDSVGESNFLIVRYGCVRIFMRGYCWTRLV